MVTLVFYAFVIGLIYTLGKRFIQSMDQSRCPSCEGKGYWVETRGEKNTCRACGGSGRIVE